MLRVTLTADAHPQWLNAFVLQWTFENIGHAAISIDRVVCPQLSLHDGPGELWTLQGAAVDWGQDFAFPLPVGFQRDNFLGHVDGGAGGGIPLAYFWNRQRGLALMHIEAKPKDWFMPVASQHGQVTLAYEQRQPFILRPGESVQGLRVIVSLHRGDFYEPLAIYRGVLTAQGVGPAQPTAECFEPEWCSWGYEFDVQPGEVLGVLPKTTELGLTWLTLDDRWFDHYGDWNPREDTFPNGVEDIKQLNKQIHDVGALSQIWWYPLCVEDGVGGWDAQVYGVSQILKDHGNWLVHNADGSVARNNRGLAKPRQAARRPKSTPLP